MNKKYTTKDIALTGLGIAIVCVATMFIKIPNSIDGYYNLGDGFILLFASLLNPWFSFIIGGLGSGLADIASGYAYYFFFTLIIKGFEGFLVSYLIHKVSPKLRIPSYFIGSVIMVVGYFFAKWILKGSAIIALGGVLGNIGQGLTGIVIAIIAYPLFKKLNEKKGTVTTE